MSEPSDTSDEISYTQDDKDEDFKIEDYRKEIDSDDSYCDIPETNNDDNVRYSWYKCIFICFLWFLLIICYKCNAAYNLLLP